MISVGAITNKELVDSELALELQCGRCMYPAALYASARVCDSYGKKRRANNVSLRRKLAYVPPPDMTAESLKEAVTREVMRGRLAVYIPDVPTDCESDMASASSPREGVTTSVAATQHNSSASVKGAPEMDPTRKYTRWDDPRFYDAPLLNSSG